MDFLKGFKGARPKMLLAPFKMGEIIAFLKN